MRLDSEQIREWLRVYFIMGTTNCRRNPEIILKEAIDGGISIFQFREKGDGALTGKEKYHLAEKLQDICRANDVPFVVNDDIDLAIALNADGVHIGQEDESVDTVRKKIGENKILGVSAHTVDESLEAIQKGADYLGIGPVFPTTTKLDTRDIQATSLIKTLRNQGIDIPIVGIGGIKIHNAQEVIKAGADGVSVITAISEAHSALEATESLKKVIESAVSIR